MAVAVGIFRYEKIVADQERRLHRSRRDVEGLEQKGADYQRDQESVDDDTDGFTQTAFGFRAGCHAHGFPNSPLLVPARWQNISLTRIDVRSASKEMVLVLMLRANSGFPNFARAPNIPPAAF